MVVDTVFLKLGFGVCVGSEAAHAYPKFLFFPTLGRGKVVGETGVSDL